MPESTLDVAVIGGGHAGLGISYFLTKFALRHIVFERARIGETWRTQRWKSFALNSPNKFNTLPGDEYKGSNPEGFDTAGAFVSYLHGYASRHGLPVREQTRVVSVVRTDRAFRASAESATSTEQFTCRQVVIASGGMNVCRTPSFASSISFEIKQCHAGTYRTPEALPDGAVLVVGSAQSGLQIAEDLLDAGRRVYLSTSAVGRVPRRYRGKDILEWLLDVGFYDMKTEDVTDPAIFGMKQPQVSGVGPFGRTLSIQSLARKGAVIVGKVSGADGTKVEIHPNAARNMKFSDEFSAGIKATVEKFIADRNIDAPPAGPDLADEPDVEATCASNATSLDLKKEEITSIVWATGFAGDFSYLKGRLLEANGVPLHRNGVLNSPGLFILGIPWLRKRKSGIVWGVNEDAAFIADRVREGAVESPRLHPPTITLDC